MTQEEINIMKGQMEGWSKSTMKLVERCQELQEENQELRQQIAGTKEACANAIKEACLAAVRFIQEIPDPAPKSLPIAAQLFGGQPAPPRPEPSAPFAKA